MKTPPLLIFYILLFPPTIQATENHYTYHSVYLIERSDEKIHTKDTVTINKDGSSDNIGLSGAPYGSCLDENWICTFSLNLNFAIPKQWNKSTTQWKYKKYTHTVNGEIALEYLGRTIEATIIHVKSGYSQPNNYVFYSKKYGIVGFTMFFANSESGNVYPITFISSTKYGYGSDK